MARKLAQLKKIPDPKEYLEFDFYDDDGVREVNRNLYKDRNVVERKEPPGVRFNFAIFPKDK